MSKQWKFWWKNSEISKFFQRMLVSRTEPRIFLLVDSRRETLFRASKQQAHQRTHTRAARRQQAHQRTHTHPTTRTHTRAPHPQPHTQQANNPERQASGNHTRAPTHAHTHHIHNHTRIKHTTLHHDYVIPNTRQATQDIRQRTPGV